MMIYGRKPKGEWVPLNGVGGVPAYDGVYLVTFDDGFVATVTYEDGDWELWADAGEPIAWKPLPDPYKVTK